MRILGLESADLGSVRASEAAWSRYAQFAREEDLKGLAQRTHDGRMDAIRAEVLKIQRENESRREASERHQARLALAREQESRRRVAPACRTA